ncbi:hypothetical protein B0H19DRAFT_1185992 [Mycena capillaripes]|nr:hypothetical protein B0H19DRAFT_1185992 [Mycena capillaripes]
MTCSLCALESRCCGFPRRGYQVGGSVIACVCECPVPDVTRAPGRPDSCGVLSALHVEVGAETPPLRPGYAIPKLMQTSYGRAERGAIGVCCGDRRVEKL